MRVEDYSVLKKCVSISILDFKLLPEEPEFYSCFHLREDTRNTLYTDKMEFHVLELPKLPKELKEEASDILLWAKFINAERKEEFDMLASKNKYIKSAYEQLRVISQSTEKRLEYEAREKAIRDHNQMMYEAQTRGLKEGLEQGMKQGLKQGIEKGIEQGMKRGIEKGMKQGVEQGRSEGRIEGIQALILDNQEEGVPKERILMKLEMRFNLTQDQAARYFE